MKFRLSCQNFKKFEISRQIFGKKNAQISIFLEIRLVGAGLFRANRETEGHNGSDGRFSQILQTLLNGLSSDTGPSAQVDA